VRHAGCFAERAGVEPCSDDTLSIVQVGAVTSSNPRRKRATAALWFWAFAGPRAGIGANPHVVLLAPHARGPMRRESTEVRYSVRHHTTSGVVSEELALWRHPSDFANVASHDSLRARVGNLTFTFPAWHLAAFREAATLLPRSAAR
jgi:hypothetical protein